MRVEAIWSGGQTGADQGGLEGAELAGVATGGWMPRGFLTEDGPRPEFAERFGMTEHSSAKYPRRTLANILDTDATVIVSDPLAGGSLLTLEYCQAFDRPHYVVQPGQPPPGAPTSRDIADLAAWIVETGARRLNVAGNRESKSPGLQAYTRELIKAAVEAVNGN